jgi:hypothetical protein
MREMVENLCLVYNVHNGVGLMVGSPAVTHQFLDLQLTNHGFSAKSLPLLSGS